MSVFCLLQPSLDYCGLVERERRRSSAGQGLFGLCYNDGYLFVGEQETGSDRTISLAVYHVQSDREDITFLDRLELGTGELQWPLHPSVDFHSRHIVVPWHDSGMRVARLDGDRLVRDGVLSCVRYVLSVSVRSPNTLYACDWISKHVHVVDIRNDKITSTLEKPDTVEENDWPQRVAVLGDRVMVSYSASATLAVYRQDSPVAIRVIRLPYPGVGLNALGTDRHMHFLVSTGLIMGSAHYETGSTAVVVIDVSGNIRHTLNIDTDSDIHDLAVVKRQLWLASVDRDITIMSSQSNLVT